LFKQLVGLYLTKGCLEDGNGEFLEECGEEAL
jgi:hypothetical protein